jgi:hypothetical protein
MQRKKKEKLTDMVGSETIAYTPSTALGAKLVDLAEGDMKVVVRVAAIAIVAVAMAEVDVRVAAIAIVAANVNCSQVREAPKVLGAPVSCGTCQDYFSVERCVVPYTLPCGHKHCGNCLRDVVCEFGSGKNEGKVISQCTVCRKMVTHARLSAIPRDSALAERAEGVRITYGYDGDGVQTGRIMLSPPKTVPENVRQLTDCLTHLQDACDRRVSGTATVCAQAAVGERSTSLSPRALSLPKGVSTRSSVCVCVRTLSSAALSLPAPAKS